MTSTSTPSGGLALTADDLLVVMADVWEATFGCALTPLADTETDVDTDADADADADADTPVPRWWAAVDILDDQGVMAEVVVAVDEPVLAAVARVTFGVADPEPDHMTDVAAEAANIMGGNVKGILALQTRLSPPRAGTGAPRLGSASRTSVHAIDDRGRRVEVHVIHVSGGAGSGAARNEE